MTDELAEEILKKYFDPCGIGCTTERQDLQLAITLNPSVGRIILAMQAYHEAKLREALERENQYVTDEDIQAWALKRVIIDMQPKSRINTASENAYKRGLIEAATAMRDGEIKPVSRDNDC